MAIAAISLFLPTPHQRTITTTLPQDSVLAPRFERDAFRAAIAGEGTNIDIP